MLRATLRSPSAEAAATSGLASATSQAPAAAPAPATPRAAAPVPSRAPAGVIQPRRPVAPPTGQAPATPAPARAPAAPVRAPLTAPAAATRVAPRPVQAPAPANVPTQALPRAAAPVAPAVAPKPRTVRKPAAPKVEAPAAIVHTETVLTPTPVEGVEVESVNGYVEAAPATGTVDKQLFGEQPAIEIEAEVLPAEDPNATAPGEPLVQGEEQFEAAAKLPVIPRPPTGGAVARSSRSFNDEAGGLEGDWDSNDLKFPQLKVVQGSGTLSSMFDLGTVIYADTQLLAPASMQDGGVSAPIYFVPLSVKKQWRENLTKDQQAAGEMPRVVDSQDEVENLGGSTQWIGNQKPAWSPSARCLFLLEQPEGIEHPSFNAELDGRKYGVAVYYAGGTSFNTSAKVIYNTGLQNLQVPVLDEAGQPQKDGQGRVIKRTMLYKNFWTLQFARKPAGDFIVWQSQARILAKEESGPEVREYIETLMNNRQSFNVADDQ